MSSTSSTTTSAAANGLRALICKSMKKNTLEKIEKILLEGGDELEVNDEIAKKALIPLERMLELAGD